MEPSWSDCGWTCIIWVIKATYLDIYHTFVRFTADTEAGLSNCAYDKMIVLVYFFFNTLILVLTGKGEMHWQEQNLQTHHTIMFIILLSFMLNLW